METVKTNDDEYFHWVFRKWFVAMVACAIKEDVTNQTVIIFSGKQGVGKTTWLKNLLPNTLKGYMYSGIVNPTNKDTLLQMSENILINMDEISTFDKKQTENFKELISKPIIRERRPYDKFAENYIRRASFVGSTNNAEILNDVSSNRRYLVIEVLDIDYQHKVDLDKAFAQALSLFNSDFKFWFDGEDINRINQKNEAYRIIEKEEELIKKYFEMADNGEEGVEYMSATEIVRYIKDNTGEYTNSMKLGKYMSAKGFKTIKKEGIKKYIMKFK